jgi:hypothetical protein
MRFFPANAQHYAASPLLMVIAWCCLACGIAGCLFWRKHKAQRDHAPSEAPQEAQEAVKPDRSLQTASPGLELPAPLRALPVEGSSNSLRLGLQPVKVTGVIGSGSFGKVSQYQLGGRADMQACFTHVNCSA